jgi:Raf kinase inhibitor-like YbhB/YbcL family protein
MRASRRPSSVLLALLAVTVVTVLAAGCGTSGRTLRDPKPGATAPPRKGASTTSSTAGAAVQAVPGAALSISTTAWTAGGEIPRRFTCDGQSVSPPLTISGAPEGTVELVVVVSDQDAGGFLHWVVAGVPPGTPSFPQGGLPAGAIEAPNAGGGVGWFGPCPPAGATHTYDFTVYALTAASGLSASSTQEQLDAALETSSSTAAMTGTYTRS